MLRFPGLPRINEVLFFSILVTVILYFGRELFVLVTFAGFLAMLMTPLSNKLEKIRIPRVLSSLISVLMIVTVIVGVIMLLSAQISNVVEEIPQIKEGLGDMITNIQTSIRDRFGLSFEQQVDTLKDQASGAMSSAGGFLTGMVKGTFTFLGSFALVLVFTFLFLLSREKYEDFVVMLYRKEKKDEAKVVIAKISKVAQQYLTGRIISIFILGILYIIGFTILGIKNAALLSAIAAVMSFIPYIGPLIGGLVPFLMAIISGSMNDAVWVLIILTFAQLFDNYFVEPYVVGGSVSVSPFFAIFILLIGGTLWGIAGVILFLPLLGIVKIIFENVETLQPYAYLVGDQHDSTKENKLWTKVKGIFSSKKK